MKNIYKIIGLLIVVTLLIVGCSPEEPKQGEVEQPNQSEEDIADNEEPIEQEKEEVKEEEIEEKDQDEVGNLDGNVKSKVLIDMMNAKRYTTKTKMITNMGNHESEALGTTVVADGQTFSTLDSEGTILEHIEKDGKLYLIMHDSKTIIVSDVAEEKNLQNTSLIYDDLEYIGKGKEEFLGNKRAYEEYKIEIGTVKYYFDKKEVDGIKIVIDMEKLLEDDEDIDDEPLEMGDATIIMDILSYEKDADMSVFELPKDYEIVGN